MLNKVLSVPRSELQARLEAEKIAKAERGAKRPSKALKESS
jgi:hypothetical protein